MLKQEYKKHLNKKDPIDAVIIDLAKHKILNVNAVNLETKEK